MLNGRSDEPIRLIIWREKHLRRPRVAEQDVGRRRSAARTGPRAAHLSAQRVGVGRARPVLHYLRRLTREALHRCRITPEPTPPVAPVTPMVMAATLAAPRETPVVHHVIYEGARGVNSSRPPMRAGLVVPSPRLRSGGTSHLFGARAPWWTCGEATQSRRAAVRRGHDVSRARLDQPDITRRPGRHGSLPRRAGRSSKA